jgi:hypothetical protein
LSSEENDKFHLAIKESERYQLGDLGHVFVVDGPAVGYIKEDGFTARFDLVNEDDERLAKHHSELIDILSECLD